MSLRCKCTTKSSNYKDQCANNTKGNTDYCHLHQNCSNIFKSHPNQTKQQRIQYTNKQLDQQYNLHDNVDNVNRDVTFMCSDKNIVKSYNELKDYIQLIVLNNSKSILIDLKEYDSGTINIILDTFNNIYEDSKEETFISWDRLQVVEQNSLLFSLFIEIGIYLQFNDMDTIIRIYNEILTDTIRHQKIDSMIFDIKVFMNLKKSTRHYISTYMLGKKDVEDDRYPEIIDRYLRYFKRYKKLIKPDMYDFLIQEQKQLKEEIAGQ